MSVVDSVLEAVLEACTAANHTGKILRQFKLSILGVPERPIQIKGFDSKRRRSSPPGGRIRLICLVS